MVPAGVPRRELAATVAAVTGMSMPVFLVGALAVQVEAALGFGSVGLGVVIAFYYLVAAATSVPLGHLTDRLGAVRVLRLAGWSSAAMLVMIAVAARSWIVLLVLLAGAAVSASASQPAANLYLSQVIPMRRQGLAFGVKQSAVPLAAMLGGIAVPTVALTIGWRWAYVAAALITALSTMSLPPVRWHPRTSAVTPIRHRPLVGPLTLLTTGFGFGLVAASSLAAFLVSSGTAAGLSNSVAGVVAAVAGAAALGARLVTGVAADRRGGRHVPVIATMLITGAVGYLGLGWGVSIRSPWLFACSAVLAFGVGWGWNGLFNFAIVRIQADAAAWATGVTQVGGRLGSVAGPLCFGILADHFSYPAGWLMAASSAALAAGFMIFGHRALLRATARSQGTT